MSRWCEDPSIPLRSTRDDIYGGCRNENNNLSQKTGKTGIVLVEICDIMVKKRKGAYEYGH